MTDRPRRRSPTRDEGAMLVAAAFILAAALLLAIGSAQVVPRTQSQVLTAPASPVTDLFLAARDETIAYVSGAATLDPNATLARHLQHHLEARFADPLATDLSLLTALAVPGSPAHRTEYDPSGNDLVEDDGTYVAAVCRRLACEDLPYDGASDGFVHNETGELVAVLVYLRITLPNARVHETLIVPLGPVDPYAPTPP